MDTTRLNKRVFLWSNTASNANVKNWPYKVKEKFAVLELSHFCNPDNMYSFKHVLSNINEKCMNIRKTCPCKVYPLKPHVYIVKLGYAWVYLFCLFLLQNIDCGYSLEPPRRGGSNVYQQSMFWSKNKKNIKIFLMKFSIFIGEKNLCILHGHVFIMSVQTKMARIS